MYHILIRHRHSFMFSRSCLWFSLLVGLMLPTRAEAYDSFTAQVSFYQGIDLSSGMTEFDPTVITLIIGSGQEVETVSAPEIDQLFEFSPQVDIFFGFSTQPDAPVTLFVEQITAMMVLEDTSIGIIDDTFLASLPLRDYLFEVFIDSDDLVVLLTEENEYILLGNIVPDGMTVQFTYWQNRDGTFEIPEPSTLLLMGIGMVGMLGIIRRTFRTSFHKEELV